MNLDVATAIVSAGTAYIAIGAITALLFVTFGLQSDDSAEGSYTFRPLIVPGLALLWPLVVLRWAGWWQTPWGRAPGDASRHLAAWICIAVLVPALLLFATLERQKRPATPSTIQLSGPGARP